MHDVVESFIYPLLVPFYMMVIMGYACFLEYPVAITIMALSIVCLVIFYPKSARYVSYASVIAILVGSFITYAVFFIGSIILIRDGGISSAVEGIYALVTAILLWRFVVYIKG